MSQSTYEMEHQIASSSTETTATSPSSSAPSSKPSTSIAQNDSKPLCKLKLMLLQYESGLKTFKDFLPPEEKALIKTAMQHIIEAAKRNKSKP